MSYPLGNLQKKEDASELVQARLDCKKEQEAIEVDLKVKEALWSTKLGLVGNIVHDSVPISDNEVKKSQYQDHQLYPSIMMLKAQ